MTETNGASSCGRAFAEALARKDFEAIERLLHADIDFRGMTPGRSWEADEPEAVTGGILQKWFEDSDHIEEVLSIDTDSIADRSRVAYRFRGVATPMARSWSSSRLTTPSRTGRSFGCG